MKIFKMVKEYIYKYKLYLGSFILFNLISWLFSMITPYITGKYIDSLVKSKDIKIIYYFTGAILIIGVISIIISYISNLIFIKMQTKAAFDLNYDILEHVKKLPLLYFKDLDSVYLNQRINSDSNTVISFVISSLLDIITKSITFIFAICILFIINIKLTLMLLSLIPIYIIIYFAFKSPLFKIGYDLKEKQNKFFSKMNEQLSNIRFIKLNSTFEVLGKQLKNSFSELLKSLLKYTKISYLFSSCDSIVKNLYQLVVFFFGGIEIMRGRMTIGEFTMISSYFSMLIGCTSYFLNLGKAYQDALISFERIKEIINVPVEINGNDSISSIDTIELNNVSFSYNDNNILHNLNYKFVKGKVYCIIGENGVGKSTFVNLTTGLFNESYNGNVYYNSKDINELDLYSIRKKLIGITEQEPTLMNDTILNNISYGLNSIDEGNIENWFNRLNINDFINKLTNGINSNIYEKAINISGGEKQKLSLARILIKDPDVIIFDEPTSALDVDSIGKLKNVISEIKENKIIIIITHNKEVLDIADEIIDLNKMKYNKLKEIV